MTETLGWLWPPLLLLGFFAVLGDLESKPGRFVVAVFLTCVWLKTVHLDFPEMAGWF